MGKKGIEQWQVCWDGVGYRVKGTGLWPWVLLGSATTASDWVLLSWSQGPRLLRIGVLLSSDWAFSCGCLEPTCCEGVSEAVRKCSAAITQGNEASCWPTVMLVCRPLHPKQSTTITALVFLMY